VYNFLEGEKEMNKNTKKDKMIAEEKEMEWMMEGMTIIQERKLNEYDQGQKSQEG